MSYLDLFKTESTERGIYGVPKCGTTSAAKVLILSHLLQRVLGMRERHTLLGLYSKYNRGSKLIVGDGGASLDPSSTADFLTQTISRVIDIDSGALSGVGTFEEQIVEFIAANSLYKEGEDAEVWINVT